MMRQAGELLRRRRAQALVADFLSGLFSKWDAQLDLRSDVRLPSGGTALHIYGPADAQGIRDCIARRRIDIAGAVEQIGAFKFHADLAVLSPQVHVKVVCAGSGCDSRKLPDELRF